MLCGIISNLVARVYRYRVLLSAALDQRRELIKTIELLIIGRGKLILADVQMICVRTIPEQKHTLVRLS